MKARVANATCNAPHIHDQVIDIIMYIGYVYQVLAKLSVTKVTPAETHLLHELMRIHQVMISGFQKNTGMPPSRFLVLRLLANAEQGIGVMDLAKKLGIDSSAVTRQIQAFEREGMLVRVNDLRDKRRCRFKLSPKGNASFQKIHKKGHQLESKLFKLFQGNEIKITTTTLRKIRLFLEERAKD